MSVAAPAAPRVPSKKSQLYDRCAKSEPGTIFFQTDLSNYNVATDVSDLVRICQELVSEHLFQQLETHEGAACWRIRSKEDAAKIRAMTSDEKVVYQHIESAGNVGVWTKVIRAKTNMHQASMTKALKSLESKALVKNITSVKAPGKKMYMLFHLTPSADVAGTVWYSDGELDIDFIEQVSNFVAQYVRGRSWKEQPGPPRNKATIDAKKRQVQAARNDPKADRPKYRPMLGSHGRLLVPFQAGYSHYPTCSQILEATMNSQIFAAEITEPDMQRLLEMMVFDGKMERMGNGYRTVRELEDELDMTALGNGFSQVPCSQCPVFNLCEEGGPVNAANCVYFEEWLQF